MIGWGTYAFFWQWRAAERESGIEPMPLTEQIERTAEAGIQLFQICDYPPLDEMTDSELDAVAATARDRGITLELGTRGVDAPHLERWLVLCERLGARLLRSMVHRDDDRPDAFDVERRLRSSVSRFADAGVRLALETYEAMPARELAGIVNAIDHDALGICLDPGNGVSILEHPRDVIDACAERTIAIHVKDFTFTRNPGWVGFTFAGAELGRGLLPLDHLLTATRAAERNLGLVVEHWLPWQTDAATTINREIDWTASTTAELTRRGL